MKKLKSLILILIACAFVFAGCGAKSSNLKVVSSNKSASAFYFQGLDEISFIEYNAEKSQTEESLLAYMVLSTMVLQGQDIMISVASAMDFCIGIAEEEISSETTQKIYEYTPSYVETQSNKMIVVVDKKKGKSLYTTRLFMVAGTNTQITELLEQEPYATYNLSISRDKSQGLYEFSDTANKISGDFKYVPNSGKMLINMDFYSSFMGGEQKFEIAYELYSYQNSCVGGRIISKTLFGGNYSGLVYEFFSKPFAKKSKLGFIKDDKLILDLTQIDEEDIATANSGDSYGYSVAYENTSDLEKPKTTVKTYGIFPAE